LSPLNSWSKTIYQNGNFGLLRKIALIYPNGSKLINRIKMRSNLDLSKQGETQEGQFLFEERNPTDVYSSKIFCNGKE